MCSSFPRSTSFGGISPTLSHWPFSPPPRLPGEKINIYSSVPPTPNDGDGDETSQVVDDSSTAVTPPPSYDAALSMKPATIRLGRSATNVSNSYDRWFKWLNNNLSHLVRHHQVTPTANNGGETSFGGGRSRLARFNN
uniref:Uncharacterized protein n=1 Tax=Romanomermis culicivorax TaxID=13658 RepID=A0A915I4N6_ROMCU